MAEMLRLENVSRRYKEGEGQLEVFRDLNMSLEAGEIVALVGPSGVGKSSLLNALTGRNSLARTSNTPGRTQELNLFDVGEPIVFRLVDTVPPVSSVPE